MKPRDAGAFTLIELLVGLVLTTALVGAMLAVAGPMLELWRRVGGGLVAEAQATAALDALERDVQSLVVAPPGGGQWLVVSLDGDVAELGRRGWTLGPRIKPDARRDLATRSPVGDAVLPESARFGRGGAWLRLFAAQPEADGGLPVALSYQILRRAPGSRPGPATAIRYVLCRSAVDPARTLAAGFDLGAADYRSGSAAARRPATITRPNLSDDALAVNVLDFGVAVARVDGRGEEERVFPAGPAGGALVLAGEPAEGITWVVDVVVRIATEEGARRLAALEAARSASPPGATWEEAWWRVAEAHSRVYRRRVLVRSGGS